MSSFIPPIVLFVPASNIRYFYPTLKKQTISGEKTLPVAVASWKVTLGQGNWKLTEQLPASGFFR